MIKMTQITDDLTPYRDHTVILWGEGELFQNMLGLFRRHGIYPSLLYQEEPSTSTLEVTEGYSQLYPDTPSFEVSSETPLLFATSFPDFIHKMQTKEEEASAQSLLIQLAFHHEEKEEDSLLFCKKRNLPVITTLEAWTVLHFMEDLEKQKGIPPSQLKHDERQQIQLLREEINLQSFADAHLEEELLILCMPPKTGDHTLINTFQKLHIPHYFVFHSPEVLKLETLLDFHPKVKIITALRDPIAENISLLYQIIEELHHSLSSKYLLHGHTGREFFRQGGDVQCFFDLFVQGIFEKKCYGASPIQEFVPSFQREVLNILDFPFSKAEGYSLCQKGNLSVFTFQLEKLNHLLRPLSDFVGCEISSLTMGNVGADKWVGKSYLQAQNQLTFPPDYFQNCYNADWVQHCYSPEDIAKFKARWSPQIKENMSIYLP